MSSSSERVGSKVSKSKTTVAAMAAGATFLAGCAMNPSQEIRPLQKKFCHNECSGSSSHRCSISHCYH
jgi:hypothetical protein